MFSKFAEEKAFMLECNISYIANWYFGSDYMAIKKNNFMAPFCGWGSTTSKLEPLRGGSLLFTTKFPEIPCAHFIDLGRTKGWVKFGATMWFWPQDPWIGNPVPLCYRKLFRLYSGKKKCIVKYLNYNNYVSFSSWDHGQIGIKSGTKHVIY